MIPSDLVLAAGKKTRSPEAVREFKDHVPNTAHAAGSRTTADSRFAGMLKLSLFFALIKLLLHVVSNVLQAHLGWGYFTDEMYYLLCGERLDWAYVDHGPIVALQARLAMLLFGTSLVGIRMFAALAGAAKLVLTGVLAWQLGAGRRGQLLALASVLLCPLFLAVDSFLSMGSFESVFWMTAIIAIVQIVKGHGHRWWVLFGTAAGIGCDNKPSMAFFLAALLLGLLATRQRKVLRSAGALLGTAITLALVLPLVLWQAHHGWAMYHFLHNATAARHTSIRTFVPNQGLLVGIVTVPLLAAGLVWLLAGKTSTRFRFLGWTYLMFLVLMMALRSKDYYLTPIYPLLFAAGGVAIEQFMVTPGRRWVATAYLAGMFTVEIALLPLMIPMITPDAWLKVAALKNVIQHAGNTRQVFPGFYALRFGWQELTDDVTRVYTSLSPAERAQAGIFCGDWNTASAINFLGKGRGLPFAISGHNNFFVWGPQAETGAVMIVVTRETRQRLLNQYREVEQVGSMHDEYALAWHMDIYLCRGRRKPFSADWQSLQQFD